MVIPGPFGRAGAVASPMRWIGVLLLTGFLAAAILAPVISPADPRARFDPYQPPSWSRPLGTNDMGNDLLSELLHGSRISISVGFGAALLATLLGTMVGLVAGYYRGWADEVLMGLTDVVLMIPQYPPDNNPGRLPPPQFYLIRPLHGAFHGHAPLHGCRVPRSEEEPGA